MSSGSESDNEIISNQENIENKLIKLLQNERKTPNNNIEDDNYFQNQNENYQQLQYIDISDQEISSKIIDEQQSKQQEEDVDDFLKPLPILPRSNAYQEGQEIPKWKKRQTFEEFKIDNDANGKIDEDLDYLEEDTIQSIEPEDDKDFDKNKKKSKNDSKIKSSDDVQEKLLQYADQIQLQNFLQIDKKLYPNLFKYQIYESYKPCNLSETRRLLQLYLQKTDRQNNPAKIYETFDREYFRDFYNYTQKQLDTQIPSFINQHTLLQFDSHFECGNLDSAYLVQENEYNLLMKVDTNTKGNSLWFYYKVSNGRPGQVVQFNILNFSRDLKTFYQYGMNISVMRESGNKNQQWEQDRCFDIIFQQSSELVKSIGKISGQPKYYYELSFKYKFETAEENQIGN
eukprot:403331150